MTTFTQTPQNTRVIRPEMSWGEAFKRFIYNNKAEVGNFQKFGLALIAMLKTAGLGTFVLDDALFMVPVVDFYASANNYVLGGFVVYAIMRIRAIHKAGNTPRLVQTR